MTRLVRTPHAAVKRRVAGIAAMTLTAPVLAFVAVGPAQAASIDPVGSKPVVTDPVGSKPVVTDPVGSKPVVTDPVGSKPPQGGQVPNPVRVPAIQPPTVTPPARVPVLAPGSAKIVAGRGARVQGTAPEGSVVRLHAYTRPSTVYRVVRTVTVGESGAWAFEVKPRGNTRLYVTVDGGAAGPSTVVTVAQEITARAVKTPSGGVRITGRVGGAKAGQLVSVYYTGTKGKALAGRTRTKADGTFTYARTFSGKGVFAFTAETANTVVNAGGASAPKKVSLR